MYSFINYSILGAKNIFCLAQKFARCIYSYLICPLFLSAVSDRVRKGNILTSLSLSPSYKCSISAHIPIYLLWCLSPSAFKDVLGQGAGFLPKLFFPGCPPFSTRLEWLTRICPEVGLKYEEINSL